MNADSSFLTIPIPKTVKKFYETEAGALGVSMSAVARKVLKDHAIATFETRGEQKQADRLRKGGRK